MTVVFFLVFTLVLCETMLLGHSIVVDGVPLDGSPEVVFHTFQIGLVVLFYVLAAVGIVFAVGCLLFNFIFRGRK